MTLATGAASPLRTSMYEASWLTKGKTKNYHNQTSSAFHIVCRTACSLYLSVLRHNVILNIQLNHGGETANPGHIFLSFSCSEYDSD